MPVIEPDTNCTPATVSLLAVRESVPPFTTTLEVSASTLLAPRASVPTLTAVVPV